MAYSQENRNIQDYLNDINKWNVTTVEKQDQLQIQLSYIENKTTKLQSTYQVKLSDFKIDKNKSETLYTLKRDAGSVTLIKDKLHKFDENAEFRKYLDGIIKDEKVPSGLLLVMALGDMGFDEVKVLEKGKINITVESLMILSSKQMDAATLQERISLIKEYGIMDSSTSALVVMADLNIDRSYIKMLADNGYTSLNAGDILGASSSNLNNEYIQGVKKLGYDLSFSSLLALKSMKITPDWIEKTNKKAGVKLPFYQLILMREQAKG
ncbi:hypothetical protein [Kordia sp.]|uniref:hypothetical protein n=1 Tax=Kordia sp. TaxID=1965332 RepID=UPI003B5CC546